MAAEIVRWLIQFYVCSVSCVFGCHKIQILTKIIFPPKICFLLFFLSSLALSG